LDTIIAHVAQVPFAMNQRKPPVTLADYTSDYVETYTALAQLAGVTVDGHPTAEAQSV
jgi:hypothetical protein